VYTHTTVSECCRERLQARTRERLLSVVAISDFARSVQQPSVNALCESTGLAPTASWHMLSLLPRCLPATPSLRSPPRQEPLQPALHGSPRGMRPAWLPTSRAGGPVTHLRAVLSAARLRHDLFRLRYLVVQLQLLWVEDQLHIRLGELCPKALGALAGLLCLGLDLFQSRASQCARTWRCRRPRQSRRQAGGRVHARIP